MHFTPPRRRYVWPHFLVHGKLFGRWASIWDEQVPGRLQVILSEVKNMGSISCVEKTSFKKLVENTDEEVSNAEIQGSVGKVQTPLGTISKSWLHLFLQPL